jgi:hypothetical protein
MKPAKTHAAEAWLERNFGGYRREFQSIYKTVSEEVPEKEKQELS